MFLPILWSSWEAETCQLSTRPRLDASEQLGGGPTSEPPQSPPAPQALFPGLRGPLESASGPQDLLSRALQAPFSSCSALFMTQDLWRIELRRWWREHNKGRSLCLQWAARPAPAPASSPSGLPHHPGQLEGLPTSLPGAAPGQAGVSSPGGRQNLTGRQPCPGQQVSQRGQGGPSPREPRLLDAWKQMGRRGSVGGHRLCSGSRQLHGQP